MNFDALRLDMIDQLCIAQWTGGPDAAYYALRERSILQVDAVIRLHGKGSACRCPGPMGVHEAGQGECLRK